MAKRAIRLVVVGVAIMAAASLPFVAGAVCLAKEPAKVTFGWWGNVAIAEDYEIVFDRFHQLNPDIVVEGVHWGYSADAREKLTVTLAAGTAPDVFMIPGDAFAQALRPLDAYLQQERGLAQQLVPDGLAYWRIGIDRYGVVRRGAGPQVGLPLYSFATAVAYNGTLFELAGLRPPAEDWTYDDLAQIGRKLTQDTNGDGTTDIYGVEWYYRSGTGIGPLLSAFGGTWPPFADNPLDTTIDNPKNLVGLEVLRRWIHEDGIHPRPSQGLRNFSRQNVAMIQGHNDTFLGYPKAIQDQFSWDVAPMPVGPQGRFSTVFHQGIGINARSNQPDAAWRFIAFFLGREGAILQNTKTVRLNSNIVASPEYIKRLPFNGEVIFNSFAFAVPQGPNPPAKTDVAAQLYPVWNGEESLTAATERIAKLLRAEIAEVLGR